ncbi:DUF4352 domain-containing protein [Candidatus Woesearchaeota archaeon]|nr:DUF4352 domain-containing protein [Candidatus Woesearchaeota archaeon]
MTDSVKKPWYKKWWAIAIFIFIGLIIISSLFGGNDDSTENAKPDEENRAGLQQQEQQQEVKTYQLGDEIQAGDFTWKITGVSTAKEIGQDLAGTFFGETADGIFVIVDVEVSNTAKSAKYLTNSFVKLIDEQSREFSPNTAAAIYLKPEGSALLFEQINPGITKKGKIVYDVPEGVNNFNVKITSNLLSSNIYNLKLTINP